MPWYYASRKADGTFSIYESQGPNGSRLVLKDWQAKAILTILEAR